MDGIRLSRGLGWLSVGLGLTELAFPERLCELLAVRRRSGLLRALGVREVLTGLGLLYAASRRHAARGARAGSSPVVDTSNIPGESWRGSGLAEDVGVPPHEEPAEPDDAERERRMREAERQLGLPNPDTAGA